MAVFIEQFFLKYPLDQCYRIPSTYFHASRELFLLNYYMKHYLPAYAMDILFSFWRQKPK